jgi:uncharacterized protein (DUF433 family)
MNAHHERIETKPEVQFGKPGIKVTRITVGHILRKLAAGMTPEQLVREHPHLLVTDIHAAEAFAADYLADEEVALWGIDGDCSSTRLSQRPSLRRCGSMDGILSTSWNTVPRARMTISWRSSGQSVVF